MPAIETGGTWSEAPDGIVATREFTVTELVGSPASSIIKAAVEDPDVPARESPHPEDPSLACIYKSGRARDQNSAIVTCEYEIATWRNAPGLVPQQIDIDASIVETTALFDINDQRISTTWFNGINFVTHYPRAQRFGSLVTLTVNKLETTSESDLVLRAADYVETVNDAPWFGWPARQWKLDDLQVRTSRFAGYREASYTLTLKRDPDWRFLAFYVEAGRVPPGATETDGYDYYDIRRLQPFNLLPITIPNAPP